ncbi:hypothetical protein BQ8794_180038 [Mesorhizobium prunaredense]|uniref:Uncharacterized protein n=1 Tax=Mesorhizobium prunaredense TaxID=1631249 RepID=A0A1R3V458_9HYPH|nr:hypothetical protein BQ8794_180038 [Mesorhizobium prunaredense]
MKTGRYIRETFFVAFCGAKNSVGLVSGKRYRCKIPSAVNNRDRHAAADAKLRRFFENLSPCRLLAAQIGSPTKRASATACTHNDRVNTLIPVLKITCCPRRWIIRNQRGFPNRLRGQGEVSKSEQIESRGDIGQGATEVSLIDAY